MKYVLYLVFLIPMITVAHAEDIKVTADNYVELHQLEQKVVASGNAVASKKDTNIKADKLIGYYNSSKKAQKGTQINRIKAIGNVRLSSTDTKAFGDNLDYDLSKDTAILIGTPAKIQTLTETITAEENIIYYPQARKAIATGNVKAIDKDANNLYADQMTAWFTANPEDPKGNLTLKKVDILGNVRIVSKDAVVNADKGIYLPLANKIKLYDNIIINQKGNELRGDKAETNLKTGISKLLSGNSNKRVKGVFREKD